MSNMQSYRVNIISNYTQESERQIATAFRFDGRQIQWQNLPEMDMPEGKIPIFLCLCGSSEFSDNGRDVNEYECVSCGQFVDISIR